MAQVVDSKGKKIASPSNRPAIDKKGGGASALKEDLARGGGVDINPSKGYKNSLANVLQEDLKLTGSSSGSQHSSGTSGNQTPSIRQSPTYASTSKPSGKTGKSSSSLDSKPSSQSYAGVSGGTPVTYGQSSGFSFSSPNMLTSTKPSSSSVTSEDFFGEENRGRDETNDIYERDMLKNGMSQDYLDNVIKHDPFNDFLDTVMKPHSAAEALDDANELDPQWQEDRANQLMDTVDDGTMDRPHLLSDWMTGKQYYHYVHDLGMPGMPEDQIDIKNGRYSKSQQRQMYGFPVYSPNGTYDFASSVPNTMSAVRTFGDYIGNIRSRGLLNDVGYDITTDTGHGVKTFPGRDFDMMMNGYASQVNDLYDRAFEGDPDAMSILMNAENQSSPYTTMVREHELPDGSKHYGVITERRPANDLENEDTVNDLLFWDIDNDTEWTYPDENGVSTYGNATLNLDNDYNIVSGTLKTKDGYVLNIEPDPNGGFRPIFNDDAFNRWWNSHYNGSEYVAFSDGSSAVIPAEDVDKAIKNDLVNYNNTSLKDIEGFDPDSLTVGTPTSLKDTLDLGTGTGSEVGVVYMPDMVLPDGTAISRDVVYNIANDDNPDDWKEDGIRYGFEPSGFNPMRMPLLATNPLLWLTDSRPRRLMHDELIDDEGFHFNEIPNWITDAAANSARISLPVYQWFDAVANAAPYAAGIESGSGDEYGRYQTSGYEPNSEENTIKFGTTLFGPLLENLAGYGHEPLLDPMVEKMIDSKFAKDSFENLLLSKSWDSVGEAMEEIIGNYVDEPATYGLRNAWANPISRPYAGMGAIYDEDHNQLYDEVKDDASDEELSKLYDDIMRNHGQNGQFPVLYDEHGREFRDPNTSGSDRFINAIRPTLEHWRETANAALGGAGVSWLYGMPELVYGAANSVMKSRRKNDNFSPDEQEIGANDEGVDNVSDIYVPESVRGYSSDRIFSNDYTINPGAPIRFKE